MSGERFLLGVDGGGTTTRAWIVDAESDLSNAALAPRGEGRAGGSNPVSVGAPAAKAEVLEAVAAARTDAGLTSEVPFAGACLGLAGVGSGPLASAMLSWSLNEINRPAAIVTDAEIALHAAQEDGIGVVLIAGTGSFVFARDSEEQIHRCGGWGRLLGDEGGGYAIALEAFRHLMREEDGRAPASAIREAAFDYFSVSHVRAVHAQVNSQPPGKIAGFAPRVIKLATSDSVAEQIVVRHVEELSRLVQTIVSRSALPDQATLAMTGGLLVNCGPFRSRLESRLSREVPSIRTRLVAQPVVGALRIAKQQLLGP